MSEPKTTRKKNVTLTSEDIRVDRKAITRVVMVNVNKPSVIEINISLYAIPNEQMEMDEYEEQINRITKRSSKVLRGYVRNNPQLFEEKSILDINFTSANLRKGYNKSVQMSLFVRQNPIKKFSKIRNEIKETIKTTVNAITEKIVEEGFKCYKKKQNTNTKLK